jgi:hypothetical protein
MRTKKKAASVFVAAAVGCGSGISPAATLEDYSFFDSFDSLTASTRYADVSSAWFGWNGTSVFESPVIDASRSFSPSKCLSNSNSSLVVAEEQRAWLETNGLPSLTGSDAIVKFKFLRVFDQGTTSRNKLAVNLVELGSGGSEVNKFAIDISDGAVVNNSTNTSIFGNVSAGNTWYELELRAPWNTLTQSFGQSANVTVRNAQSGAVVGSGSVPSKFASDISKVDEVQIVMDAGYSNGVVQPRPTNFIDDLSLAGKRLVARSATIGHEYVQSHPLTTMGLVQLEETFVPAQYKDQAGLNTLLAWKPRLGLAPTAAAAGMPWHMQVYRKINADDPNYAAPFTDEIKNLSRQIYNSAPGNAGWMMWDEPRRQHFEKIADGANWYRTEYPNSLVYSNVYSAGAADGKYYYDETYRDANGNYPTPPGGSYSYDQYLSDYLTIVKPDVLLVDAYPYPTNTNDFIPTRYFLTLEKIRTHAQAANIPYWNFIQTVQSASYHLPSESDLRMNVYSSLGYGFTGLANFLYHDPAYFALLDAAGQPTSLFTNTAQINTEVANLGDTLKLLTSTQVRFVRGSGSTLPTGTTAWTSQSGGSYITSIVATKTGSMPGPTRGDVLIGHFKPMAEDFSGPDASGETYFMLVNLLRGSGVSAADAAQSIRLDFNFDSSGIDTLMRLNRLTGEPERISLIQDSPTQYHAFISLVGGTGDLFKFGEADFVGVPSGDATLDGSVNTLDFNLLAGSFGLTGARWKQGDFNLDGTVNTLDFNAMVANYGKGPAASLGVLGSVIPEPMSGWLLLGACAVLQRRSQRRGA